MRFIVKAKGITIEAETEEDLNAAVRVLHALDEKPTAGTILAPPGKTFASSERSHKPLILSQEQKLGRLYRDIQAEPKGGMMKIVKTLAGTVDWATTAKLKEIFPPDGSGLGGTIASIGKQAVKGGLKKEEVLMRAVTKEGIRYRLTPAMMEIVRAQSEKEQAM